MRDEHGARQHECRNNRMARRYEIESHSLIARRRGRSRRWAAAAAAAAAAVLALTFGWQVLSVLSLVTYHTTAAAAAAAAAGHAKYDGAGGPEMSISEKEDAALVAVRAKSPVTNVITSKVVHVGAGHHTVSKLNSAAAVASAATISGNHDRNREGEGEGKGDGAVWISLSLCVDDNAADLKAKGVNWKEQYPYTEAMLTAVALWTSVAGAKVILSLVSNSGAEHHEDIIRQAREAGASAIRVVRPDPDLGCVTESQLQRIYAYRHEGVREDDIVVTSDVDSFPTSSAILDPLLDRSYDTWIWQWFHSNRTGKTFPLSFIGMRASLWKLVGDVLWDGLTKKGAMGEWMFDQGVVSRSILKQRICSCNHQGLWKRTGLKYEPFDDPKCYHGGREYGNNGSGGWKWVHTTPGHRHTDIMDIKRLILQRHDGGMDDAAFARRLDALYKKNKKIHVLK